ncbi:response regulator transcription factor [Dactylosporangium darangshiense]|uniref:Response regulator transcription factor n=1 Tax=Dactylosporangium darangshiense TaxID=579108 RepID=A0ABP8DV36_9ACTN
MSDGGRIKVLIVDDHEVVRHGLRFMLSQEPDFEIVGEAGDGAAALAEIRRSRPDVVLLDLMMPVLDGLGVLYAMHAEPHRPAFIVLTSYSDENRAMEAMRAGALSYLAKSTAADRVTDAVRAAATGGSVLAPTVAAALVNKWRENEREGPLERLSARERDVLAELSRGRSNREIARALSLGEQTVKSHVSSILTKLDLQDRTQAAIFGLQHGLVPLGEALQSDE